MNPKTDSPPAGEGSGASSAAIPPAPRQKPRIAIFIATAGGLGYLPEAPGTWGSLLGVALAALNFWRSGWTFRFAPPTVHG
ncbi:MAG: hypothetical protein ACREQC_03400, partial [Candidatus Binataceae bacterium]